MSVYYAANFELNAIQSLCLIISSSEIPVLVFWNVLFSVY